MALGEQPEVEMLQRPEPGTADISMTQEDTSHSF